MDYRFRIEGIYDLKTLHLLEASKIREFTFDFRPKSFNFIQIYLFKELLNSGVLFKNIYLQFSNEKEFIIDEIVKEIPQELKDRAYLDIIGDYDFSKLPLSFYWNFDLERDWRSILKERNLKGLIFPYELLARLNDQNRFIDFIKLFYEQINLAGRNDLDIYLAIDWDSDIFPSLLDMMNFNGLSMPVNSKIEVAYRQLDGVKFTNSFNDVKYNLI